MGLYLTDANCIKQREYVNIPEWNKSGYLGDNITICHFDTGFTSHSECCADIIQTILPNARVFETSLTYSAKDNKISECYIQCKQTNEKLPFEDFIMKYNVSQLTASFSNKTLNINSPIAIYLNEMKKKYNLLLTCSNGNSTDEYGAWVGAAIMCSGIFFDSKGKIQFSGSPKPYTDFTMFMGFQSGNSFSTPAINAIGGLLRCKYGKLSQDEIYAYLKMCSQDLGIIGKDNPFGWGLPILPHMHQKYITLTVGSTQYKINQFTYTMDTSPVNKDGNVFVPVRIIAEALDKKVDYQMNADKTIKITISDSNNIIILNTGSTIMKKNTEEITLNFAPYIDGNNRTLVPIRAISEAFNCKVDWVASEKKVVILN
jgi:hypothetical protein